MARAKTISSLGIKFTQSASDPDTYTGTINGRRAWVTFANDAYGNPGVGIYLRYKGSGGSGPLGLTTFDACVQWALSLPTPPIVW